MTVKYADPSSGLFLGIDGGGTRTRAALADQNGRVIGWGTASGSNPLTCGTAAAVDALEKASGEAFQTARMNRSQVDRICLGLAGVSTDEDRGALDELLRKARLIATRSVRWESDLGVAWAGGFAGNAGIVLVAGTGSACYGRTSDGRVERAGGWGPLADDAGSGYAIGLAALRGAVRVCDGRLPPSRLPDRLCSALELSDLAAFYRKIRRQDFDRRAIASLAPVVMCAAQEKDPLAVEILRSAALDLAGIVSVVAKRMGEGIPLCLAGSVARSGRPFEPYLREALSGVLDANPIVEPILSPVMGAVLLALKDASVKIDDSVVRNLRARGW